MNNKNKVLITGVAGFIASHVASRFLDKGFSVVGIDDLSTGYLENVPCGVDFIRGDLSDKNTIEHIPKDCHIILHLSGQSSGEISFDDPVSDLKKNTVSTLNLIKYGIENRVDRIVYASSMSVYGHVQDIAVSEEHTCKPLSCYGVGKQASESYLRIYSNVLPYVSLRMFNVYGSGQDMSNLRQGMVSIYLAQALDKGRIEVKGSTERFRDFIYIDDVVETWFRAATYSSSLNQTINLGTGVRTTVESLLKEICELLPGTSYFIHGVTPGDQKGIFADTSKLRKYLQIDSFTSLKDGLRKFIDKVLVKTRL